MPEIIHSALRTVHDDGREVALHGEVDMRKRWCRVDEADKKFIFDQGIH
jgi:hypothetical protein